LRDDYLKIFNDYLAAYPLIGPSGLLEESDAAGNEQQNFLAATFSREIDRDIVPNWSPSVLLVAA